MSTTTAIHYAVQIDLTDITSDTDATIGLYAGFLRWVTDRPDYDGATVVPTGDNDGNVWKEGILTSRSDIGQANRIINILASGDYGTLSGFTFSGDNTSVDGTGTGDKLSDVLFDNDYFVISRKVHHYVIIADVFYYGWSGIVSKIGHDEMRFKITCQDDSKTIHKQFPPQTITKRIFPNLSGKTEGKPVPVCFGLVDSAKLLNVSTRKDSINIMSAYEETYKTAPISAYTEATKTITILIGDLEFTEDSLVNFFFKHIVDGNDQVLKITANTASTPTALVSFGNEIDITLEGELTEAPVLYPPDSFLTNKGSWCEIFDFRSKYIVSNDEIDSFFEGSGGVPTLLKYWNTDSAEFIEVSEISEANEVDKITAQIPYPGVNVLSKVVDFNGDYTKLLTYRPKSIKYLGTGFSDDEEMSFTKTGGDLVESGEYKKLHDGDLDEYEELDGNLIRGAGADTTFDFQVFFAVEFPDGLLNINPEQIYILYDSDMIVDDGSHTQLIHTTHPRDNLGLEKNTLSTGTVKGLSTDLDVSVRLIPGYHYNNEDGKTAAFNEYSENLEMVSFYDKTHLFRSYPIVRLTQWHQIRNAPVGTTTFQGTYREICFAIERTINVINEDLFAKVNGEVYGGAQTNNIYLTIVHLLRTYDGIAAADIELGNLLSTRVNWTSGRQVDERKSSKEYLQEIAKQCFIGIYPTRDGKRGFKAFRSDKTFSSVVHASDTGTIVAGSISKFEKSDINQVYNDFEIKYDFNPASKEFEQSIYIHNADQSAFPNKLASVDPDGVADPADADPTVAFTGCSILDRGDGTWLAGISVPDTSDITVNQAISLVDPTGIGSFYFGTCISIITDSSIQVIFDNIEGILNYATTVTGTLYNHYSSIQAWKEYAGGFTNYTKGSGHWTACHNSFVRSGRLSPLPKMLSECKWFVEVNKFYPNSPGDNSTAHLYLDELIEWTTRQKEITEYEIPLTATNIALEMLTPITFRDQKFTNGDDRVGYITKIKINPGSDTITIGATLEPPDIDDITSCNIQETGSNADDIQETGSQSDDFQETGLC